MPELSERTAAWRWLRARAPEAAIFAFGAFLRITMAYRFDPRWGIDANAHWAVVEWMAKHAALPPQEQFTEAIHPPFFYAVAALLTRHGFTRAQIVAFPILFGTIRLALFWAGLEWLLPNRRWVRLPAFVLAATLPASVYMDGCLFPEPMHATFVAAALLAVPRVFEAPRNRRWKWAALVGLLLGLALLTKVTGIVVFVAIAIAVVCDVAFTPASDRKERLARLLPWSAALGVCLAIAGWYYARNVVKYHKPFLTSFDTTERAGAEARLGKLPLLDRRTLGFFIGWDTGIYEFPYFKGGDPSEHPRFLTIAMASTFLDYYNAAFSGLDPGTPGPVRSGRSGSVHSHVLTPRLVSLGRWAAAAGTLLLLVSTVAGALCVVRMFRDRRWGLFCLTLVPFVTVFFQLYAALRYPFDDIAVIKGTYMQFGMLPMIAFFGIAVEWSRARLRRIPLTAALLAALWVVSAYTLYCRTRITLLPVSTSEKTT